MTTPKVASYRLMPRRILESERNMAYGGDEGDYISSADSK